MANVVIVGGGWAGCAAAVSARKAGAKVKLLERTDQLLGTGLVGGIMRNNGRFTATEEMIALGGGELFKLCDKTARHRRISFPGHNHATLYDIGKTPVEVSEYISQLGVEVIYETRIIGVNMEKHTILSVKDQRDRNFVGDVFIDTTGTAGPISNCTKYGNGCAMCILRCPTYGGRVSLTGLTGVEELMGRKADGTIGAMSGSCKLYKDSLSPHILELLNSTGVAIIPIPEDIRKDLLGVKACQQYALPPFRDNIILLDTGHAKLMTPYYSLDLLRRIPGLERARYEDPYSGGRGNSMRFFAMAPRDNYLRVMNIDNLFCAGEKVGPLVGHTEAIITGTLAGYNSVRQSMGMKLLKLPRELAVGEAISFVGEAMQTEEGIGMKFTFSGSVLFERIMELGLYTIDIDCIRDRVEGLGLTGVFTRGL